MKTTQLTATVFTDLDGERHTFRYESLEDLCYQIFEFIGENDYFTDDDIIVTLADETQFRWCHTMAHYHFAKSRTTFEDFFQSLKKGEGAV